MKIGIIGDLHIGSGNSLGRYDPSTQLHSRLIDFTKTLNSLIDQLAKKDVKYLVFPGDIFETRHPTSAQMNVFSKAIQRASAHGMNIIIVAGNHDQQRTISTTTIDIFGSLQLPNVFVYSEFGVHTSVDEHGKPFNFILMPYRDRRMMLADTNEDAIKNIKTKIDALTKGLVGPKIAVGHFMTGRAITGQRSEIFSMSELVIPYTLFNKMDVVIMGHVHQHSILKKSPLMMYSGSMEKNSFGEKAHQKVSIVLDTNDLKNPEITKTIIRNLYEINLNYSEGEKYYKSKITSEIIKQIDKFHSKNNLKGSIVKLVAIVKDNDKYYIDQDRIKEFIKRKQVKYLLPLQISTITIRKLRNSKITETSTGKEAMTAFIKSLSEPDNVKYKLLKLANSIIEQVEGK